MVGAAINPCRAAAFLSLKSVTVCVSHRSGRLRRASLPWPYPTDPATLGSVNYLSLAKELKSSHHISLSLMQGGHNANLQHMFKQSQGSHYKEERRLLAPAQLYVHLSTHWPEAAQWLVERHGQGIVQKAGFMQPPGESTRGEGHGRAGRGGASQAQEGRAAGGRGGMVSQR